jgi:hypothetical protein
MAEILKNRQLQLAVMVLSFLLVFVPYFFNIPQLNQASNELVTITSIVTAFTVALAVVSQYQRGMSFVTRRVKGWPFKAYMLISIALMLIFALFGRDSGPYQWVMLSIVNPLSSVNYCILAFYMSSTAARAFRARNTKAILLLLTGFIVLLYQAPLTGVLFPAINPLGIYLGATFVTGLGAMFLISVTVGAIVFGVRVLLGKEPSVLGLGGEE